jgi:hypothetical protein
MIGSSYFEPYCEDNRYLCTLLLFWIIHEFTSGQFLQRGTSERNNVIFS